MNRPALPAVPACWSWEMPPLPVPCHLGPVLQWQDGRCAICGWSDPTDDPANDEDPGWVRHRLRTRRKGLVEDHDHATGDTRGFLCERCNTQEGRGRHPVFALYRERHPTAMLGVLARYRCATHPAMRNAENDWESALDGLRADGLEREREAARAELAPLFEEVFGPAPARPAPIVLDWPGRAERMAKMEALKAAAARVGMTQDVWWDVEALRRYLQGGRPLHRDLADEWRYVHRVGEYANVWRPAA